MTDFYTLADQLHIALSNLFERWPDLHPNVKWAYENDCLLLAARFKHGELSLDEFNNAVKRRHRAQIDRFLRQWK